MRLTGRAAIAGVMGWPVGQSRSPLIHGFWLERHGIDGAYVPLAVEPQALPAAVAGLRALGFRGANVTVPHKEAVMAHLDAIDATAQAIGAVNTILRRTDGTLAGTNTDAYGFAESLRPVLDASPRRHALVLGAGGAARAVIHALAGLGFETIHCANRDRARAERLAGELAGPARIASLAFPPPADACAKADLLVNATRLGMAGEPPLGLDLGAFGRGAIIADIVYDPLDTELLVEARARGLVTVDGLGMLLHQARGGFKAWFGVDPEVTPELRAAVAASIVRA